VCPSEPGAPFGQSGTIVPATIALACLSSVVMYGPPSPRSLRPRRLVTTRPAFSSNFTIREQLIGIMRLKICMRRHELRAVLYLAACGLAVGATNDTRTIPPVVKVVNSIRITVDPRVELMSIAQEIGGFRDSYPFLLTKDSSEYRQQRPVQDQPLAGPAALALGAVAQGGVVDLDLSGRGYVRR
jgi:hypothetical protein